MFVGHDSQPQAVLFVDSSARSRYVLAATSLIALACFNMTAVAVYLAEAGPGEAPRGLWLYLQFSLDFFVAAFVFYAVSFLAWLYRAYKNLPAVSGDETEWHILWVFAGWVLPIINLVFPYLLMREIGWKSSGPEGPRGNWSRSLLLWWALFLFSQSLLAAYWQMIAAVGIHAVPAVFAAGVGPRLPEIVFAHVLFTLDTLLGCWLVFAAAEMQRERRSRPVPPPRDTGPAADRHLYY